ncbi:sulfite exporter TauE/SafE family protein [Aestuariirhabdus litorea]|uniref:Probable membrane transporter protein n=1 Tax=Aestuariirhabdus litorea TaxID=2528527 RepID=A0A3P3VQ02_9GAMM|nr:sulfite exporter TauE/SafE family protein [Aestuariirhabdus litorea]RRJ84871.1 sulfite exporter TauE/SafE family protein [Aestuariirhabdus litorea]RWW98097.1 sulfite exporter TauE/SafE family protein [Endozoicomonadaceae bacterium GTF-13]
MDILAYILAGAGVGLAVGITGVGGGSLMTPLLLLFGFPPHIAIGTDLMYASLTKASGVAMHHRRGTIDWRLVLLLGLGSMPAALITVLILYLYFPDSSSYGHILTSSLGVMLILTALVLLFKNKLVKFHKSAGDKPGFLHHHSTTLTWVMGVFLGTFVTLSSVGAGAFGTAVLMVLYPALLSIRVVGTDLAHAVPLTLVAGLGHLLLGNVDFYLLGCLLMGSLPAIYLGTRLGSRLPDRVLHPILASTLLALGLKYAFF